MEDPDRVASEPAASQARCLATLGALLLEAGESVSTVKLLLTDVRESLDLPSCEVAVVPTVVIVTVAATDGVAAITSGPDLSFRSAARVARLPAALSKRQLRLEDIPGQAAAIRREDAAPRMATMVSGNALTAASFAALFQSPWWAVAAAFVVGGLVGTIMHLLGRSQPGVALQPFVLSFISTLSMGSITGILGCPTISLYAVIAPVVLIVPGAVIAKALLETTSADIVAGSARLLGGAVTMAFMVAGMAAGAALTGLTVSPTSLSFVDGTPVHASLAESGWQGRPTQPVLLLAVVGLAISVGMVFRAGVKLSAVITGTMVLAYSLTLLLGLFVPPVAAIGVAAGVVFLVSKAVERWNPSLPSAVTFFPAFLLYVPGSVGLIALATGETAAVINAILSFASLSIGIHVAGLLSLWVSTGTALVSRKN